LVRCPFCGYKADLRELKLLQDPWRFRFYEVKMLECPKCKGVFNYYTGKSPSTSKISEFYVRVRLRSSKKTKV